MKIRKLLLFMVFFSTIENFAQTLPNYVPTSGLVGWWSFYGNANDISGNGHNGTINGGANAPVLSNDRYGNANSAYYCSGAVTGYKITIPLGSEILTPFTIMTWLKPQKAIANPSISNVCPSVATSTSNDRPLLHNDTQNWIYYPNNTGVIDKSSLGLSIGTNSIMITDKSPYEFSPKVDYTGVFNDFINVIIVYDNISYRLYLNGVLISTRLANTCPTTTRSLGSNLNIGYGSTNFGQSGNQILTREFILDDIGIWGRALTSQEIIDLYNNSALGVADFTNKSITIYPNPFNEEIKISLEDNENYVIKIINTLGQELKSFQTNNQESTLSLSGLDSGVYIMNFYNSEDKLVYTKKIIKK